MISAKARKGKRISKNFVLDKRITNAKQFNEATKNGGSIYLGFRIWPCGFLRAWQFHCVQVWLDRRVVWTIERKPKDNFKPRKQRQPNGLQKATII